MDKLPMHEAVLIPKSLNRIVGNLSETEIIKRYAKSLSDELDHCAIRHRLGEKPRSWEFAISLGVGWNVAKKESLTNCSRIWISDSRASSMASLVAEALSHWGQTYVGLEHRSCKPVARQDVEAHIHLEPFQMNGVKAQIYAQRLEELGRDLGRVIADYVVREKAGGTVRMTTAADLPQAQGLRRIF